MGQEDKRRTNYVYFLYMSIENSEVLQSWRPPQFLIIGYSYLILCADKERRAMRILHT